MVVQGLVGNARCGRRPFLAAVHSDYALIRGQLLRRFAESLLPLIGSEDRLASANPAAVGNRCGRRCVGGPSSTAGSGSFPWFILRVAASSNLSVNRTACKLRLQVPSALRAPAAGYLKRVRRAWRVTSSV